MKYLFVFFLLCFTCPVFFGQSLTGYVFNEDNQPVPFASVFVKFTDFRTETDIEGKYFFQFQDPDEYELVIDAFGYEQKLFNVYISEKEDKVKNVWLASNAEELGEVVVSKRRRDPAYDIIQQAIKNKKAYMQEVQSSSMEVYIKAKEVITEKEKKNREKQNKKNKFNDNGLDVDNKSGEEDPFAIKRAEDVKFANSINLVETQITRHFQLPNKIKEIKTAYTKYGDDEGLYYLTTVEGDMDFYQNLVNAKGLSETPFISPLNPSSIVSYKFKLEDYVRDSNDALIYKIKVTPRKSGNATVDGYVWIKHDGYRLVKLDLNLPSSALLFHKTFNVKQEYIKQNDSVWFLEKQGFNYSVKMGGANFVGYTDVKYTNIKLNISFPKKYFNNELGIVTEEALKRDSTYWDGIRPEPLTREEQKLIAIKDSIKAVTTSKRYLDSIDREYNEITFGKVTWHGVSHINRAKKYDWSVGSLADWFKPFSIGGFRYGPYFWMIKKYESERILEINPDIDYGIRNKDLKGDLNVRFLYDPFRQGRVGISVGREFEMFNFSDGYLSLFNRSNWIDQYFASLKWRTELFNGFYIGVDGSYLNRMPLTDYKFSELTDKIVENNVPLEFESNQALLGTFYASYTPFQKYVREPKRKVVLGSKWPTFSVHYQHGFKNLLSSDIDFSYLSASITQSIKVRTLGTSNYRIKGGKFLNKNKRTYTDLKIFPKGDRIFFSLPLLTYQLQDTTLIADNWYFEFHHLHQFNGALINNVPLLKKTGITLAAGTGLLYISDMDYLYKEAFAGVVKSFRIRRQRFRLGVFGVIGDSNFGKAKPAAKISFSMYSRREKKWGF